ncbi:Spy/CpxP family protein refolding chaperone [Phormidium sp. CLA17]|uniref:Spy/CpxP family protein refolding chaperone n=1 Tax=Leptolyngbya sp. Cla-17 TaxID=2803751 RepID=UPI0014912BFD|nr:Spy/CpxP family protein refolding chaperone [Leptolyngbya sp. Cla-17]MBM0742926.1 Spy/CpxP family protein refolding chaperone [Leptolyngbya sp. Cla-17]
MSYRSASVIIALLLTLGSAIALPISTAASITLAQADTQSPRLAKKETWLQDLNLSKEQIQKIQAIRRQYQDRLTQQRQSVKQAQQELKELMASGDAPAEEIRQKFSRVQTLQQTLAGTRMESMLAIRNVLTAEQRQKLTELMQQQGKPGRGRGMGTGF